EHNEKDVLTLACLAVHLSRLAGGLVPTGRMEPEELYRLALWHDKLGQGERADETFQELIDREEEAADYWLDTADYYKRQGRYEHAVALWEKAIERKRRTRLASLVPYVELAMYYEHQQKDVERALAYAELALERAQARVATAKRLEGKALDEIGPIVKRVERLRLKQNAAQLKTAKRSKRSSVQSYSASAPTITAQSLF
ncbi:MAG: hypothetical protein K0Q59_3088, partial [Paenibacillus sp.]|nr:hypothetical protein [Paenibacillus sp.]